jgi:hypothetical protein
MKPFRIKILATLFCLGLLFSFMTEYSLAAGKKQFGETIPPTAAKATLAELIAKPETYEGKDVVVEGYFAGACGDGDFFFKDKFEIIEADPPKPEVCYLKKGTPIRLYGLVKVHRKGPVSETKEESEEAEGKAKEKEIEKGQVYITIVGKGVEIK